MVDWLIGRALWLSQMSHWIIGYFVLLCTISQWLILCDLSNISVTQWTIYVTMHNVSVTAFADICDSLKCFGDPAISIFDSDVSVMKWSISLTQREMFFCLTYCYICVTDISEWLYLENLAAGWVLATERPG